MAMDFSTSYPSETDAGSVGAFTLPTGVPFRLRHLHRAGLTTVLLSSRYFSEEFLSNKPGPVAFDIWAVKVNLFSLRSTGISESRPLEILWHRRGEEVPVYTTFVDKLNAHLIIGGSSNRDPETQKIASSPYDEPTPDENPSCQRDPRRLLAFRSRQENSLPILMDTILRLRHRCLPTSFYAQKTRSK
jgi:hypothetical protein